MTKSPSFRSTSRCFFRAGFHALLSLLVFSAPCLVAQVDTNLPSTSHRWLLIVETSRAMQRRAAAAVQIASGLVSSGMNGQMQRGDTLGLWTYNETLRTGEFPMQELGPDSNKEVARRVMQYLQAQQFDQAGRLERVIPQMNAIVKNSDFITVILISDGSTLISGTPFDENINANFKAWQKEQEKTQAPFVTLLRGKYGRLTDYAVNTPPFPLDLPKLPAELTKAREQKVQAVEESRKPAPPVTLPPLIVSGRKPAPTNAETVQPVAPPQETVPSVTATNEQPSQPTGPTPHTEVNPTTVPPANAPALSSSESSSNTSPVQISGSNTSATVAVSGLEPEPDEKATNTLATATPVSPKRRIWVIAGCAAGGLLALALVLARRTHPQQASLITRSLDREKK